MAICTELGRRRIAGVSEICPSNASYLVRFDPDVIHPDKMMQTLKDIEAQIGDAELELPTRIIEMPVKKVTSVMFGGPALDILYVTSMAKPPLPRFPGDGVQRGSLFAIYDLGIRGVPEPRFAG